MKKSIFFRILLASITMTALVSCEEELNLCGFSEDDTAVGSVFVETTGHLIQITSRVDEAMRNGNLIAGGSATIDNANVTWSNDTVTINYGPNDVSTDDGRLKRGAIIGYVYGDYRTSGSITSISLNNYYVDNVHIMGAMSLTNNGTNGSGNWVIQLSTTNLQVATDYNYAANLNLEWLSGFATDSLGDDSWTISGMSSGVDNVTGTLFDAQFTDPLLYDRNCAYKIVSGEVSLNAESSVDSVLNFTIDFLANDGCNNVVNFDLDCSGTSVSTSHTFNNF